MSEIEKNEKSTASTAQIIYILQLISIVLGITGIVGVVLAYINKSDAPAWLKSHYQFQIRTFWIGMLYILVGFILSIVIIGWFILLFAVIWLIIRSVKGLKALEAETEIENPQSWMF